MAYKKTMPEIVAEHQSKAGEILVGYQDRIQKLTEEDNIDDPFVDTLSPAERASMLYTETIESYNEEISRFHGEVHLRKAEIEAQLFGLASPEATSALAQAAVADDAALERMMDVAITSFNPDLAKVAFVAAHQRGHGDLMARYFDEFDEEARDLYQEYGEVPTDEVLDRQWQGGASSLIEEPSAQQLAGRPAVRSSGA